MRWLILLLIRKRLKLKKYQLFQFKGQKDKTDHYYFHDTGLIKLQADGYQKSSNVSINWILNCDKEIIKTDKFAWKYL